ncbi:hypothetical protein [Tannerella forsythia]|uniref:hypothetical protein n=1 Tax=Tannerella forsythia TaxID=28112 RepID=UPI00163A87B6|nr:hypothetical protein [Tannerella forsythia]
MARRRCGNKSQLFFCGRCPMEILDGSFAPTGPDYTIGCSCFTVCLKRKQGLTEVP